MSLTLETATAPMELGAQQLVIIMACRMQQGNGFRGRLDTQPVAGLQLSQYSAVTRDLRARVRTLQQPNLNLRPRRHDNRSVGQCMGADGRNYEHVEVRLDD